MLIWIFGLQKSQRSQISEVVKFKRVNIQMSLLENAGAISVVQKSVITLSAQCQLLLLV